MGSRRTASGETTASGPHPESIGDAQPVEWEGRSPSGPWIVGIGASAGGVAVLLRLFQALPPDSGCVFVVVTHLAPDRESNLAELIGRATGMPVEQVRVSSDVRPDTVYVAPPGFALLMKDSRLVLVKVPTRPPKPNAIDRFMMSLAEDQRERVIGIVLSGSDGDGSMGLKAIKSEGGFTLAQLPSSATHPDMPLNAIASGVVDRQLPVEEMPAAIMEIIRHAGETTTLGESATADGKDVLKSILEHLHSRLGMDFRGYKTPMLARRVRRRMGLCSIRSDSAYLDYLIDAPAEAEALARDFLISVTEFFREPDAWRILIEDFIPILLQDKRIGDFVRVWVPGCATGEEAYSIAMALLEHPLCQERRLVVQVFATDIDTKALEIGRRGHYPEGIHLAVSLSRLRRFFCRTNDGYRVLKDLRDAVMFAPQNLVNDPPFSQLDLISCRNLLIYMKPELQRHVLQIFHFALRADGLLALGKSETAGSHGDLFVPMSQRARIFRRIGPASLPERRRQSSARGAPAAPPPTPWAAQGSATDYARLIREVLVEQHVAAAVLTDRDGHGLYFYGTMHPYLVSPAGSPTNDLFVMVREELRPRLRAVLLQAASKNRAVEAIVDAPADDGGRRPVRLMAIPAGRLQDGLLLVTFERLRDDSAVARELEDGEASALSALEDELRNTKNELRAAIGELEATNEELKVANEEAMSANEELQSSNEELQTSKEELQAINEELTTVNQQLMEKVGELETLNDDLNNLLSSSHIPTLFLDRELNIKRFTPAAMRLFRLIPGDVNRPVTDLASFNGLDKLVEDAKRVLDALAPIDREMRVSEGQEFLRRTVPYRTAQDRIEGVVVTFTDISELRRASEDLRRYAAVMRDSNDAVIVLDPVGRILEWNRGAQAVYGYGERDVLGSSFQHLLPRDARDDFLGHLKRAVAGERLVEVEMQRRRKDGNLIHVSATFSLIRDDKNRPDAIALIERDISHRKEMERAVHESEHRFRSLANQAPVLIWTGSSDGRMDFVNHEFVSFTGLPAENLLKRRWIDLLHSDDVDRASALFLAQPTDQDRRESTARVCTSDGNHRWVKISAGFQDDGRIVGSMVDIDAQIDAERRMREANRRKDEFLAMLGHEMRNPLVPIRNAAEVLNHVAGQDPRLAWARDTLIRQVDHVTRLVDDLLDISMITRGTMRLHMEPVDLRHPVQRACEAARVIMQRKRHDFSCRVPDEPVWVEGDAVRLSQILENLLTNAAKYTEQGGSVSLAVEQQGEYVSMEVVDNGLGIEPDMLGRIFDLFVQDARSLDRSQGGLGIGLALVRHLVQLHGGDISASSEGRGLGTRISLRLPSLPHALVPAPAPSPVDEKPAHGRVLIVDDDIDAGESMVILLAMYGYQVERAVDLATALDAARRLRPQVVILDLALPDADGFEIARRLRALPGLDDDVSYIALSGFGQPHDFLRSEEAGFVRHLVKPMNPPELNRILKSLLDGKAQQHG